MLDHRDSHAITFDQSKKYDVGEPFHERSPNVSANDHPSLRHCGDTKNLPFKFLNEFNTKAGRA